MRLVENEKKKKLPKMKCKPIPFDNKDHDLDKFSKSVGKISVRTVRSHFSILYFKIIFIARTTLY